MNWLTGICESFNEVNDGALSRLWIWGLVAAPNVDIPTEDISRVEGSEIVFCFRRELRVAINELEYTIFQNIKLENSDEVTDWKFAYGSLKSEKLPQNRGHSERRRPEVTNKTFSR